MTFPRWRPDQWPPSSREISHGLELLLVLSTSALVVEFLLSISAFLKLSFWSLDSALVGFPFLSSWVSVSVELVAMSLRTSGFFLFMSSYRSCSMRRQHWRLSRQP
ncbi:hypothetical protein DFJ77DRAFT_444847 [Powellomyces hirtus]|nr:hypothetical protein DFJ77DRAFT_444847 [Powellomyces hirtus]